MTVDDTALQTLQAIFPAHPTSQLQRVLIASGGSVERASAALLGDAPVVSSSSSRGVKRVKINKLDRWLSGKSPEEQPRPSKQTRAKASPSNEGHGAPTASPATTSAFTRLRAPSLPTPQPPPAVNLPPLRLSTPEMIQHHTGGLITLIPSVLPTELASRLYARMVRESEGAAEAGKEPWDRNRWYLFDREVESPHTTSFYVEAPKKEGQYGWNEDGFAEAAHHWYNGEKRAARTFLPEMDEARELVASLVRTVLSSRERHPLEWEGDWTPNVAAANCYRGAKESVGWHSDVLTYLGPMPTIASLSLGVARPFRLRPFAPSSGPASSTDSTTPATTRTLEISLPHNSLCIMHAGCQEVFKHSIPPVSAMDVFRLPGTGKEGKAYRERINMTFRHYRPDFAPLPRPPPANTSAASALVPRPITSALPPSTSATTQPASYAGTPHCACGQPTLLRPDGKGRARSRLSTTSASSTLAAPTSSSSRFTPVTDFATNLSTMAFFWTCSAGMQNEGRTCKHWQLLDMRKEGRGRWFVPLSNPVGSEGGSGQAERDGEGGVGEGDSSAMVGRACKKSGELIIE